MADAERADVTALIELFPGEAAFLEIVFIGIHLAAAAICVWCVYDLTRARPK